jgi:HAMP domain-containing protein
VLLAVCILGMAIGVFSPAVRWKHRAAAARLLAVGAGILFVAAVGNLIAQDPRAGLATINANRRFDLMIAGPELPALALALLSLKRLDKLYWVGWGIHAGLSIWLTVIFVWLAFFWHW